MSAPRIGHHVTLPHPSRDGRSTIGACTCGLNFTYGWGRHGDAASIAGDHIREAAHAEPVEVQEMSGRITVMEGRSL